MPRRRGTGKGAKACFGVREGTSPCPVWSSPQTTSSILPHTPSNPMGPNSHVQDYPRSPGIPHGVHLRLSNLPRATRPHIQVPPTAKLYAPSPIRLHHSGCPILEQIAGWDSQRILSEIFQDTPGCPLAVPVPQSTHLRSSRKPPAMSQSPQIKMARWPKADKWGGKMYYRKYSLLSDITRWRSCSGVPRGCVYRIRVWLLRRDHHSGVLIGAGGERRSDWPAQSKDTKLSPRFTSFFNKKMAISLNTAIRILLFRTKIDPFYRNDPKKLRANEVKTSVCCFILVAPLQWRIVNWQNSTWRPL